MRCRVGFLIGPRFGFGFLFKQRLPVGDRDLVVVGMDFVEGQEAVAVAAVVDEGCLQRRFDARDLCQINVAAKQFARRRLVIELLYAAVAEHHHPSFLRVGGVDKHLVLVHAGNSCARRVAPSRPSDSSPAGVKRPLRARIFAGVVCGMRSKDIISGETAATGRRAGTARSRASRDAHRRSRRGRR